MNFIQLAPILTIIIPLWFFFNLGNLVSKKSVTTQILAQQLFNNIANKYTLPIPPPKADNNSFINNQFIAYLDNNTSILHKKYILAKTTAQVGSCCYLLHIPKTKNHTLYNSIGEKLLEIEQAGYPILSNDGSKILFISTDGSSLTLMDRARKTYLNNFFFDSRISSLKFSEGNNFFAVGSTSGKISFFDFFGKQIFTKILANHQYPIIKAIAIKTTKKATLLILSGHQPETLVLFVENTNKLPTKFEKKWEHPTGEAETKHVPLYIDDENYFAIKQNSLGFSRYQLSNGNLEDSFILHLKQKNTALPQNSTIVNSLYAASKGFLAAAINTKTDSHLFLFSADNLNILWRRLYKTEKINNLRVIQQEEKLFLTVHTNEQVLKYLISNM